MELVAHLGNQHRRVDCSTDHRTLPDHKSGEVDVDHRTDCIRVRRGKAAAVSVRTAQRTDPCKP